MARSSDSFFLLALLKDKTFQAREIRRVALFSMVYLAITTLLLGVFYHVMLGKLVAGTAPLFFVSEDMQRFNEMVPGLAAVLGRWVLIMMIVNVVVTTGIGIYITRKLGHPLMAIKRALRQIGEGDLDIRLRETDDRDFADISEALQLAMTEVRRHIASAKQQVDTLSELQNQPAKNEDEIKVALATAKGTLDYFSTGAPERASAADQS